MQNEGIVTTNVQTEINNETTENENVIVRQTLLDYKYKERVQEPVTSEPIEITANNKKIVEQNIMVNNPKLWSTENPNLYILRTEILVDGKVVDVFDSRYGFRYFDITNNDGFSLNGEYMKLHGVCMHHDQGALGAVSNYAAIKRQMTSKNRITKRLKKTTI